MLRVPPPRVSLESRNASYHFYLDDCVKVLGRLAAGSIDVIVTSPPYNLGVQYRSYDDTIPRSEYLTWTADIFIFFA